MKWTVRILAASSAVLFALCLYLAYAFVDTAISLSYARSSQDRLERAVNDLRRFTLDLNRGTKRSAIEDLVKAKKSGDRLLIAEKDRIFFDSLIFEFREDVLSDVSYAGADVSADEQR